MTRLTKLHGKDFVDGFSVVDSPKGINCEACIKAKLTRTPLPDMATCQNRVPGKLTHTDMWRPTHVISTKWYRYHISFMQHKSDTPIKVKQYLSYIEQQHSLQPKVIHADNRWEYINWDLTIWCLDKGIKIQMTAPHSPEQNGTAEQ